MIDSLIARRRSIASLGITHYQYYYDTVFLDGASALLFCRENLRRTRTAEHGLLLSQTPAWHPSGLMLRDASIQERVLVWAALHEPDCSLVNK